MSKTNLIRAFRANLTTEFRMPSDNVGKKLVEEYGALFAAGNGAIPPKQIIFKNEAEVLEFQAGVAKETAIVGGFQIELQTAAMENLKNAVAEAERNDLTITPRGDDAARRSYADTAQLWASRVNPALIYWVKEGKITEAKAEKIRALSAFGQVPEIFKLEKKGIFFSKDLSKSIIYSVAPPGASQHLSMLAFDVAEYDDKRVREILAKHGWVQTVVSDLPHFTFLGRAENELSRLGLKKITDDERIFWIPNI
ncbi:MAG: D-alanyl-D-alanine carboxypeptidase family protein [Acidobacteriota bacterium]|nr:D-alanyl-D-alanine carboxypeptidase family protein [Acidobacteriota bacterium]